MWPLSVLTCVLVFASPTWLSECKHLCALVSLPSALRLFLCEWLWLCTCECAHTCVSSSSQLQSTSVALMVRMHASTVCLRMRTWGWVVCVVMGGVRGKQPLGAGEPRERARGVWVDRAEEVASPLRPWEQDWPVRALCSSSRPVGWDQWQPRERGCNAPCSLLGTSRRRLERRQPRPHVLVLVRVEGVDRVCWTGRGGKWWEDMGGVVCIHMAPAPGEAVGTRAPVVWQCRPTCLGVPCPLPRLAAGAGPPTRDPLLPGGPQPCGREQLRPERQL